MHEKERIIGGERWWIVVAILVVASQAVVSLFNFKLLDLLNWGAVAIVLSAFTYFVVFPAVLFRINDALGGPPTSENELLQTSGFALIRGRGYQDRPRSRLSVFIRSGGFRGTQNSHRATPSEPRT
jgi:Mn2+/Fe2+ NRAMP family transporter